MTLDRSVFTTATKGHFCSLLVSNIFCYPRFPNLFFATSAPMPTTQYSLSLGRTPLFFMFCHAAKNEKSLLHESLFQPSEQSTAWSILNTQSISSVTPPCFEAPPPLIFHSHHIRIAVFYSCLWANLNGPWECTFLF